MESLADFLGVRHPLQEEQAQPAALEDFAAITDPVEFCQHILASREFRQYILNGIVVGDIPPAILGRVMDQGWGKAPERIEHTGKDGRPIETITEVRRVVVRPGQLEELELAELETTH
jgi:hypothetical protein